MWIVDDDGDMFNTDHFATCKYTNTFTGKYLIIFFKEDSNCYNIFSLSKDLTEEERLTRYYDLVEMLTGVRIDG